MKILITGANGMLGFALGRALKEYGLAGLGIGARGEFAGTFAPFDITDGAALSVLVRESLPDLVIHAAAMTDVDRCEKEPAEADRINFEGTRNVVEALRGTSAGLIFISTDFVFDGKKNSPYTVEDVPNAVSAYGRSKQKAEEIILREAGNSLIVRTSWLFGPHGKNFVDAILKLAEEKDSLSVVSDQRGRPTYTMDLAEALGEIVKRFDGNGRSFGKELSGVMHISNSGETDWFEFATEILRIAGKSVPVKAITARELGRPAQRPEYSVMDTSRYAKIAGKPLRHWKEAVAEYFTESGSFKKNGALST